MKGLIALAGGALLLLAGCGGDGLELGTSGGAIVITRSAGSAGSAGSAPNLSGTAGTMAVNQDLTNIPGVREVHMAASSRHCESMARNFQQQGLRLTLTRTAPNPMPGARKMVMCVFEGEDATPDRFVDTRYNNQNEY